MRAAAAILLLMTSSAAAQLHPIPAAIQDVPASQNTATKFKAWFNYWKQEFDQAWQTRQVRLDEVEILIKEQAQTGQLQSEAAHALKTEYDELVDAIKLIGQRKRNFVILAEIASTLRFSKTFAQLGLLPGPLDFCIVLYFWDETAKTDGVLAASVPLLTTNFPILLNIATTTATSPVVTGAVAVVDLDHQLQKTAELETRFAEVLRGVNLSSQTVAVIGGVGSDKAELEAWIETMTTSTPAYEGKAVHLETARYILGQLNRWDERHVADIHPANGGDQQVNEADFGQFRYGEYTHGLSDEEKRQKGDFDLDGVVEFDDYLQMSAGWTSPNPPPPPGQ